MEKEETVDYEKISLKLSEIKLSVAGILKRLSELSSSVDELDRRVNRYPLFFDIHDCATIFGRSTRTIRRWMDSGTLKTVEISGVLYVSEGDLCSFLSKKYGEEIDPDLIRTEIEQTASLSGYLSKETN